MLFIKDIYKKHFPGESFFYVDDSICFTNKELNKTKFNSEIAKINSEITKLSSLYLHKQKLPKNYNYTNKDFKVKVHKPGKSILTEINKEQINAGAMYLNGICRESSTFNFDLFSSNSDEEISILKNKTEILLKQIEKEINRINKNKNSNTKEKDSYTLKLYRYKKFFKLRNKILEIKTLKIESEKLFKKSLIEKEEKETIELIYKIINNKDYNELIEQFKNDILLSTLKILLKFHYEEQLQNKQIEEKDELFTAIKALNNFAYTNNCTYSYILKSLDKYKNEKLLHKKITKYNTLNKTIKLMLNTVNNQKYSNKLIFYNEVIEIYKTNEINLFKLFGFDYILTVSSIIIKKNDNLTRIFLNCIYSCVFSYLPNDSLNLEKTGNSPINYFEVLTLSHLRNKNFIIKNFINKYSFYKNDNFLITIDYSILQVLSIFKTFVRDIDKIENLILIHKYCCDTWKNGSKYLHFYTLHNQEHAINLIENSIHLLHSFSYFKLKKIDFYILFAACYLHDISMVSLPDYNIFSNEENIKANEIYTRFTNNFVHFSSNKYCYQDKKKVLCDTYKEIDSFFELNIRNKHAFSSAKEIRTFDDLNFIEPTLRELIAEVSQSHGYNTENIYNVKSQAKETLISLKYIKILLRLSDLLDLSRYRISKVILNHNLKELDTTSRFHWISHLITDGYIIKNNYISNVDKKIDKNNTESYIAINSIREKITFEIDVLFAQTTKIENNPKKNKEKVLYSKCYKDKTGNPSITITLAKPENEDFDTCNFLCKWFMIKNKYLIDELLALKTYLNNIEDYYFETEIEIKIVVKSNDNIPNDIFDYLKDYIEEYNQ